MSRESYLAGFCKTAAAHNADPRALAEYVLNKSAEYGNGPGALSKGLAWLKTKADQFEDMSPSTRAIIGAGVGGAAGGGIGAAVKGKKGLGAGAAIGALVGGGAGAVPWRDVAKYIGSIGKGKKRRQTVGERLVEMGFGPEKIPEWALNAEVPDPPKIPTLHGRGALGKAQKFLRGLKVNSARKLVGVIGDAAANDDVETLQNYSTAIPGLLNAYLSGNIDNVLDKLKKQAK